MSDDERVLADSRDDRNNGYPWIGEPGSAEYECRLKFLVEADRLCPGRVSPENDPNIVQWWPPAAGSIVDQLDRIQCLTAVCRRAAWNGHRSLRDKAWRLIEHALTELDLRNQEYNELLVDIEFEAKMKRKMKAAKVETEADYDKLPDGADYVFNGQLYTKGAL
jgi:hypothetical protein